MENATGESNVEAGFAKLQGVNFEYYMQTYSIILGRNSKKSIVDLDLSSHGGGMKISRHHAHVFFDFTCRRFALEVLNKNGCFVKGVLHLPGNPLVNLDSQDLIQIGNIKFYFLLPVRNILDGPIKHRHSQNHVVASPPMIEGPIVPHNNYNLTTATTMIAKGDTSVKNGKRIYHEDQYNDDHSGGGSSGKKDKRDEYNGVGSKGKALMTGVSDEKKSEGRSSADNLQLQQLEEKDVIAATATVLSDLCNPGQWTPMEKLHAELVAKYSSVWHHSTVRRYLTSENESGYVYKGRPWYGLLVLLKKYPEHFDIITKTNGRVIMEFVTLVSLLS